jgi:hypothetical protein
MSLKETLDEIKAGFLKQAPPEAVAVMASATEGLKTSGIMDGVVKVRDKAPDFSLPDPAGTVVDLQEFLRDGPLVVSFFRGHW